MLDQIDQALGRYYALKEVNNYFDEDGVGRFKAYAEENGITHAQEHYLSQPLSLSASASLFAK